MRVSLLLLFSFTAFSFEFNTEGFEYSYEKYQELKELAVEAQKKVDDEPNLDTKILIRFQYFNDVRNIVYPDREFANLSITKYRLSRLESALINGGLATYEKEEILNRLNVLSGNMRKLSRQELAMATFFFPMKQAKIIYDSELGNISKHLSNLLLQALSLPATALGGFNFLAWLNNGSTIEDSDNNIAQRINDRGINKDQEYTKVLNKGTRATLD